MRWIIVNESFFNWLSVSRYQKPHSFSHTRRFYFMQKHNKPASKILFKTKVFFCVSKNIQLKCFFLPSHCFLNTNGLYLLVRTFVNSYLLRRLLWWNVVSLRFCLHRTVWKWKKNIEKNVLLISGTEKLGITNIKIKLYSK